MTGTYHLIEPCCGGASLTLHLLGAKNQLLPYQGSKWRLRKQLAAILAERGHTELSSVHLSDPGPWGHTWALLHAAPEWVLTELRRLASEDPRVVYDRLHRRMTPSVGDPAFAAQHLFLQRLSHSGKAVGCKEMRWRSPGFNKTSAYGVAGTERFGEVKPMIPVLIRQLEQGWTRPARWMSECAPASEISAYYLGLFDLKNQLSNVLYLDPPYAGSTRYPNGHMDRSQVVRFAQNMAELGFFVMVSEAKPIDTLVDRGWEARCLKTAPDHDAPFRAKGEEWITISPKSTPDAN